MPLFTTTARMTRRIRSRSVRSFRQCAQARGAEWSVVAPLVSYCSLICELWPFFFGGIASRGISPSPELSTILMAYLIGQLGGLLPIPGGLGGIDGGLFGALVLFGTPVAVTAAAVLAYRVILFWLPLVVGTIAFLSLRRGLNDPDRPELCVVPAAT